MPIEQNMCRSQPFVKTRKMSVLVGNATQFCSFQGFRFCAMSVFMSVSGYMLRRCINFGDQLKPKTSKNIHQK